MRLPGLVVDFKRRVLDIEATVALHQGLLEFVACTPDTKEHEALVMVEALPTHIHAGLLLLGAENGNPYMVKASQEDPERFIHLPARGDPIVVSLVYPNEKGKEVERPVSDFIQRSERDETGAFQPNREDAKPFPDTFLFAGSQIVSDEAGHRHYLADQSGHVISISTFGDEVLCLSQRWSADNTELMWQVNPSGLPKPGTSLTLRLRPKQAPTKD